jgi:hypothetical protein
VFEQPWPGICVGQNTRICSAVCRLQPRSHAAVKRMTTMSETEYALQSWCSRPWSFFFGLRPRLMHVCRSVGVGKALCVPDWLDLPPRGGPALAAAHNRDRPAATVTLVLDRPRVIEKLKSKVNPDSELHASFLNCTPSLFVPCHDSYKPTSSSLSMMNLPTYSRVYRKAVISVSSLSIGNPAQFETFGTTPVANTLR